MVTENGASFATRLSSLRLARNQSASSVSIALGPDPLVLGMPGRAEVEPRTSPRPAVRTSSAGRASVGACSATWWIKVPSAAAVLSVLSVAPSSVSNARSSQSV